MHSKLIASEKSGRDKKVDMMRSAPLMEKVNARKDGVN